MRVLSSDTGRNAPLHPVVSLTLSEKDVELSLVYEKSPRRSLAAIAAPVHGFSGHA